MQKSFALLIIACFLIVIAAGCTNSTGNSAAATPAATAITTTVTPPSLVEQARANAAANNKQVSAELQAAIDNADPIVGAWGYTVPVEGGYSLRMGFQSNGRIKNGVGDGYSGTWVKNGPGVYTFTLALGAQEVAVCDPVADTLTIEKSSGGDEVWKRVPDY